MPDVGLKTKIKPIQPLCKWPGGKGWLVPSLAPRITDYLLESNGTYVEPFLGGASMALAASLDVQNLFLSDAVEPLIEFYTVVRDSPGELAWALSALAILGVDQDSYYRVRDMRPETPIQRAARFFYLNRLCFNGVYRENKSGNFNVPYGDAAYRKSVVGRSAGDAIESLFPNRAKIQLVSDALKHAEFAACDFADPISVAGLGDLVFCDPPYAGTFDGYSKDGFSSQDQERLAEALYDAYQRGAVVVACNSDVPIIRDLYDWCNIEAVKEQRRISNTAAEKRPRADCVLITAGI